jgi:hypothetical protein
MSQRKNPTDKMLAFAEKLATKKGVEMPDAVREDFDACRAFIDAHNAPSEKQLAFAEKIAEEQGVELPEETRKDAGKLSQWIDANKKGGK